MIAGNADADIIYSNADVIFFNKDYAGTAVNFCIRIMSLCSKYFNS